LVADHLAKCRQVNPGYPYDTKMSAASFLLCLGQLLDSALVCHVHLRASTATMMSSYASSVKVEKPDVIPYPDNKMMVILIANFYKIF
jgi:hypothetical protein